jgi:hypothetical protein
VNLGRIQILLNDDIEEVLREYISEKYPLHPYGKISQVVTRAVLEFLLKEDFNDKLTKYRNIIEE